MLDLLELILEDRLKRLLLEADPKILSHEFSLYFYEFLGRSGVFSRLLVS